MVKKLEFEMVFELWKPQKKQKIEEEDDQVKEREKREKNKQSGEVRKITSSFDSDDRLLGNAGCIFGGSLYVSFV